MMHVQVYAVPSAISRLTTSIVNRTKSKFHHHVFSKAYRYKAANTSSSSHSFVDLKKPEEVHVQASAVSSSASGTQGSTTSNVNRPNSNFHRTLWDDQFLSQAYYDEATNTSTLQEHETLKEEVRRMLVDASEEHSKKLRLIELLQRLGISYYFEIEIEDLLDRIAAGCQDEDDDLHTVALRFRLLRQHGVKISCDEFQKFKDGEGNFKESLAEDVEGMLSLYESAHLGIHGEDILDDAIAFTTANLQLALPRIKSHHLAEHVRNSLNRPIRRCLPRLDTRNYITFYSADQSHDTTLLKFAKLDFNILQRLHQKELSGIKEWWKSLNTTNDFPYARDRIVECYFWIMGVYFEPKYALARRVLTKILAMDTIVDDTYDAYGTSDELQLLTEAIQRWDVKPADSLPETIKKAYSLVLNVYREIEEELEKVGRGFAVEYSKAAFQKAAAYQSIEAKWRDEGSVPSFEEYMEISKPTSFYPMLNVSSFIGMEKATKEAMEWVSSNPKMVDASSVISRLMDDLVSLKYVRGRDHVASGMECYMKQYNVSEEEAISYFRQQIAKAWKDTNEGCLKPTPVPMALLERILNFTRAMDVIYKDDDGYTNPLGLKDYVSAVLKEPVPL